MTTPKKTKGQFYTVNSSYILDGLSLPPTNARCIMEPFAGKGDLLDWITTKELPIESYDIDPKKDGIILRDTLMNPPDYSDTWILTNPPYLARNKCEDKTVFDLYNTNDLYKCFITSLTRQESCCVGLALFFTFANPFLSAVTAAAAG